MTQLDIYELDSVSAAIDQVPGLIGPDELAKWQGNIYFTDDTVEVFGRRGKITRAASGHPCISLIGFPETGAAEPVASRDPEPHEEDQQESFEECDEGGAEGEDARAQVMYEDYSEEEDYEDSRSEASEPEDLQGQDPARRDEEAAESSEGDMPPLADDSETESSSGSSDHFRGEQTTESSDTSEDEEFQETVLAQLPINEMVMRKGG